MFESIIKPRYTKKYTKKLCNKIKHNPKSKNKVAKQITKVIDKVNSVKNNRSKKVVTKHTKKKSKSFKTFKRRMKNERIYVDDKSNKSEKNDSDEFTDNKKFSSSYFYKFIELTYNGTTYP